jgi:DnaK suppressor protein
MMGISIEQKNNIYEVLKVLQISLECDLEEAKKSSQPVELDQQAFGRLSRMDAIQQQQMQASGVRRLEKRLVLVKSAILRMNTNEFCMCVECEELISFNRLKVKPEALMCINCATEKQEN